MRYTPAAAALSLLLAVTASVSYSAPPSALSPRATALVSEGRAQLGRGNADAALDAFEAALAVQPGSAPILLALGDAARAQGMQGKALGFYRRALEAEPNNLMALAGEGAALAEKGAIERARRTLVRLQGLCGDDCAATRQLAAAIAKGPALRMVSAEAIKPEPVVSEN